jgi:hypothetical protein
MSIRNLLAIDHDTEQQDADIAKAHQEAAEKAGRIDSMKATALYPCINSLPERSEFRNKIGILAELIEPNMRGFEGMPEFHSSLASSCYLTDHAYRIGSAAEVMVGEERADYYIVSISSPKWRFSPEQLESVSLVEFVDEFTNMFKFFGIDRECGSLLAFVHGYFDPLYRQFVLSFFGLADRAMAQRLGRLRGFPYFGGQELGRSPITIQPLADHPHSLYTLVQTDWPVKIDYLEEGKHRSVEFTGLIGDPYFAQSLLWRDRWDLASATVMIGLYVYDDRLMRLFATA